MPAATICTSRAAVPMPIAMCRSWHGTFIYIGQPAEERNGGATAMIKDGLFTRFPKPDFAFAVHDSIGLPAGKVGYTPGFSASNADSVNVTVYGVGGHGSAPQETVDP